MKSIIVLVLFFMGIYLIGAAFASYGLIGLLAFVFLINGNRIEVKK